MPTVEIPTSGFASNPNSPQSQSPGLSEASPRTENNASPTSSSQYLSPKSQAIVEASAECVICLEQLSEIECGPVCVLTRQGHRACKHFFHMHCAQRIKSVDGKGYGEKVQTFYTDSIIKMCPHCRAEFDGVREVPDLKVKPKEWFNLMDYVGHGRLGKDYLVDCLLSTLPFEVNTLYEMIEQNWDSWDPDGKGHVGFTAVQPLMTVVRSKFPPFLPDDPNAWFDHWDVDGNGELTKEQIAKAVAQTLSSCEDEAMELIESMWCLFDKKDKTPDVMTKAKFLEPRALCDTLCASLAEDPRFKSRVKSALSPKGKNAHAFDPCMPTSQDLEEGMRVRVMTVIGTPRYKWGRIRPGDIGTLKTIDREKNTCRVDFPKQRSWRGYMPELEKVPDYLVSYRPWQIGDDVQILSDLARAKKQQDDRSNWVSSMDPTCGKVGKITLVIPAERKVKVKLERGTFVYVMENVVRPSMPDPPKLRVGMKVRVKAEVSTPKYQWGNVSPGDVGTVTALHEPTLTCQVSFPRHHNWKGYQPELEVLSDETSDPGSASPSPSSRNSPVEQQENSPPGSPCASPRVRIGAYIRVKPSITTPKFAWGRVAPGEIGVVTAVERTKELVTVDFPNQRNWIGYIQEMECVRLRPPQQEWSCPACTFLNESDAVACDMCDGPPPLNDTEAQLQGAAVQHNMVHTVPSNQTAAADLSPSSPAAAAAAAGGAAAGGGGDGPTPSANSNLFHSPTSSPTLPVAPNTNAVAAAAATAAAAAAAAATATPNLLSPPSSNHTGAAAGAPKPPPKNERTARSASVSAEGAAQASSSEQQNPDLPPDAIQRASTTG